VRPILFEIFGWGAPSYAVFMVLGFVAALAVILGLAPARARADGGGFERPQALDLYVVMVVSAVFGSKVGHVLFEAPSHRGVDSVAELLAEDPWHWLRIGEAGYVWYGGFIACLVVAVLYFRRRPRLDAWLFADAFAPAIMIGAAVGRTGCFLAGCCYGVETDGIFGVQFPHLPNPVHPTQLYDAGIALGLGVVLLWRFGRRRFDGENIALLLIAYPLFRAFTEAFRGDPERGGLGPLSTSQWLSIPVFLVGVGLYLVLRRQRAGPVADGASAAETGGAPASGR
jgi:phosphatidylglycerol:prolipoprotein diacylglycerol transferase